MLADFAPGIERGQWRMGRIPPLKWWGRRRDTFAPGAKLCSSVASIKQRTTQLGGGGGGKGGVYRIVHARREGGGGGVYLDSYVGGGGGSGADQPSGEGIKVDLYQGGLM